MTEGRERTQGGRGLQRTNLTVKLCSPGALIWAKAQFLSSRSCQQFRERSKESNIMEEVQSFRWKINSYIYRLILKRCDQSNENGALPERKVLYVCVFSPLTREVAT